MLKVNGEQPADVSCLSKATSSLIFREKNQLLNLALAASVAPLLLLESLWVKTLTLRKLHIWVFKDGLLLNSDWAAAFSTLAPANRSSSSVATWKPSTFQHSLMGFRYRTWGRAAAAGGVSIWPSGNTKPSIRKRTSHYPLPWLPPLWLLMDDSGCNDIFHCFIPVPSCIWGLPWHLAAALTSTTSIPLTVTQHKWVYQHVSNPATPPGLWPFAY